MVTPTNDPHRQSIVWAPSLESPRKFVRLITDRETIKGMMDGKFNAGLGQYCGLIHGNIWAAADDAAAGSEGTGGLLDAVALFQGLERPMIDVGMDRTIYVYVTNPNCTYFYPKKDEFTGKGPTRGDAPKCSVFTVFVEFGRDAVLRLPSRFLERFSDIEHELAGVIHYWEWTPSDNSEPELPENYDTRYHRKVWKCAA